MGVAVVLPQLGFSMAEGRLVSWLAANDAPVERGTPLYELESDKAIQTIESPTAGRLRIMAAADAVYAVGTVLGEIV